MRQPLTTRQAEVYAYVRGYVAEHLRVPPYRVSGAHFGWASPAAAFHAYESLRKKGWLERSGSGWRLAGVKVVLEDVV